MSVQFCKITYFHTFLQIIFEGITGTSFTGDIAIDEVNVTEGKCPGKHLYLYFKHIFETQRILIIVIMLIIIIIIIIIITHNFLKKKITFLIRL